MFFAFLDNNFGIDGIFGLVFIHPFIAIFCSLLLILICMLLGLPIRLNNRIHHWWARYFYISLIFVFMGTVCMILSFVPSLRETVTVWDGEVETVKQIPNRYLSISGWFVTVFALLHLYPPDIIMSKIRELISSFK